LAALQRKVEAEKSRAAARARLQRLKIQKAKLEVRKKIRQARR
jgi:hypothetical protein